MTTRSTFGPLTAIADSGTLLAAMGPIARWGLFVGITSMLGAVAFRLVVLPRVRGGWRQAMPGADVSAANVGLMSAVGLLVAVPLILVDQIILFRDPFEPLEAEIELLVRGTAWGEVWQLQLLSVVFCLVAFGVVRWRRRWGAGWWMAAAAVLLCATTPALSGHSAGAERLRALAVAADALHVIMAGAWLGTLGALFAAVLGVVRRGGSASGVLPALVVAFSPLALASATVVAGTGVFATWLQVGSIGALFAFPYGRVLLLKVALVATVAALGAYNWKRVTPRLGSPAGSATFLSTSAPVEMVVGLVVLLVTAVLVVMPHPTGL